MINILFAVLVIIASVLPSKSETLPAGVSGSVQLNQGVFSSTPSFKYDFSTETLTLPKVSMSTVTGNVIDNSSTTYTGRHIFKNGVGASTGIPSFDSIGYSISASKLRSAAVGVSSSTNLGVCKLFLSTGNWSITANASYSVASGNPASTQLRYGIATSTLTLGSLDSIGAQDSNGQITGCMYYKALDVSSADDVTGAVQSFVTLTTPTTYFLNTAHVIAAGSIKSYGSMTAVRR